MGASVVRAEGLSKWFRIGERDSFADYRGMHALLERWARAPLRRRPRPASQGTEGRWALRDVSFELHRGEILGLVGKNGAGKSVLLKILSRITRPTSGRAVVRGRVGSMLEVGAGFHPELTGRENISLSAAILGIPRARIAHHFDEIVDASGIGEYLDTPVKRYSSGMYLRLAFSVALHLDTEVVLIDEVFAVADAAFQRQCLERLDAIAAEGRAVLFVSHEEAVVERLCHRAILLERGRVVLDGGVADVLRRYRGEG